jgi:hypothetical protein
MGDPLAAASLVMAIIAMLYGAWSADISRAATLTLRPLKADRMSLDRPLIAQALNTKAWPLWAGALATLAIFAWRVVTIVRTIWRHPPGAQFDDVGAAFVVTEIITLVLFATLSGQVRALRKQLRGCAEADS